MVLEKTLESPLDCKEIQPVHSDTRGIRPRLVWRNGTPLASRPESFPGGSAGKESACNVGDLGSIPGLGRSTGEGKAYALQYSGLENSMDFIVHGVAKSRTRLSDRTEVIIVLTQLIYKKINTKVQKLF